MANERDRPAIPKRLEKFLPPRGDERRERFEDAFHRLREVMQGWDYFLPPENAVRGKGKKD